MNIKEIIENVKNLKISEGIYTALENKGAEIGTISIFIINKYLKENILPDLEFAQQTQNELIDSLIESTLIMEDFLFHLKKHTNAVFLISERVNYNIKIIKKHKNKSWEEILKDGK